MRFLLFFLTDHSVFCSSHSPPNFANIVAGGSCWLKLFNLFCSIVGNTATVTSFHGKGMEIRELHHVCFLP